MKKEKKVFKVFENYHGLLAEEGDTQVYGFENYSKERYEPIKIMPIKGGVFGYINKGFLVVKIKDTAYPDQLLINEGFYFSIPSDFEIIKTSRKYQLAFWTQKNYKPMIQLGKVEDTGRLNYIDGCHDSLLLQPIKKGLPCLNALYMPEGVHQTPHTHPSLRAGFIIEGGAQCVAENGNFDLKTGQIFYLKSDTKHKFRTDLSDYVRMKLIAFHPDSDFGPEDENHPMINKTIVDGVSANSIEEIRTK